MLLLHGAHPDKADKHGGTMEMVAWRMDGGATEVLSEWVVDVDRELMEREAANRAEGEGQREFAGRAGWFGDFRAQTVACQAIDRLRTTLNMLCSNPAPTSTHVYTLSCSHSAPTPHSYQTHTNPLYPNRLRRHNRLLHHLDQTSSLFRLFPGTTVPGPSTTVNGHRVSGIGNGGSTAEEFVFDPEIAGCIHAKWQDPAIPQTLDHSLV